MLALPGFEPNAFIFGTNAGIHHSYRAVDRCAPTHIPFGDMECPPTTTERLIAKTLKAEVPSQNKSTCLKTRARATFSPVHDLTWSCLPLSLKKSSKSPRKTSCHYRDSNPRPLSMGQTDPFTRNILQLTFTHPYISYSAQSVASWPR